MYNLMRKKDSKFCDIQTLKLQKNRGKKHQFEKS